jgi:hypothetical protein
LYPPFAGSLAASRSANGAGAGGFGVCESGHVGPPAVWWMFSRDALAERDQAPLVRREMLTGTKSAPRSELSVSRLGHMPECRSDIFHFRTGCRDVSSVDFTPATRSGA